MTPRRALQPAFGADLQAAAPPQPMRFNSPPIDTGGGSMEQAFSGLSGLMSAIQNRPQMNAVQSTDAPPMRRRSGFSPDQAGALNRMANA